MRALSIRQPFAELIPSTYSGQALRGIKTTEYRSGPTRIIGERFHIYAAKGSGFARSGSGKKDTIWSSDLVVPGTTTGGSPVPLWMIELAEQIKLIPPGTELVRGVIVGSAVIERVSQIDQMYGWHLVEVQRARKPRKPQGHPQPVWFNPFA